MALFVAFRGLVIGCLVVTALGFAVPVRAQPAPPAAGEGAAAAPAGAIPRPAFRDITGYRFPPPAQTVRDMQHVAIAIQLRDYCADARISDAFVKERLERFSRLTGREESCRTLLDY